MTKIRLPALSVRELVDRFVAIAAKQEHAELFGETRRMRPLYNEMAAVREELKHREGDGRHALLPLLAYPNRQVQLKAALATLAIAPVQARAMLEALQDGVQPQALEAGAALWALDEGIFKPA